MYAAILVGWGVVCYVLGRMLGLRAGLRAGATITHLMLQSGTLVWNTQAKQAILDCAKDKITVAEAADRVLPPECR